MPLFGFDYEIRYYHKDDPANDTIYGEGFTLVEAETLEEADEKNDTILRTIDPRIEWDEEVTDDLRAQGYTHTVCFDGQMTANFKSLAAAQRFIQKMS